MITTQRSLVFNDIDIVTYLGTRGSDVYEISLATHSSMLLLEGHGAKQVGNLNLKRKRGLSQGEMGQGTTRMLYITLMPHLILD